MLFTSSSRSLHRFGSAIAAICFSCIPAHGQTFGPTTDPCSSGIAYFPVASEQTVSDPVQLPMVAKSANGCRITTIRLYVDGQPAQTLPVNDASGSYQFNFSVPNGYHTLYGVALNDKGYVFATDSFRIFESVLRYQVYGNVPANGTTVRGPYQTVDVRAQLGSSRLTNPSKDVVHLRVYLDDQPVYDTDNSSANFKESFSIGTHRLVAVAYDAQGYSYTGSSTFTVK